MTITDTKGEQLKWLQSSDEGSILNLAEMTNLSLSHDDNAISMSVQPRYDGFSENRSENDRQMSKPCWIDPLTTAFQMWKQVCGLPDNGYSVRYYGAPFSRYILSQRVYMYV